ncbi:indole-3-glycerol phosphate synthase TrpC [Planctomicrobium sp. SH668]|uniref:indole-3-glycerol phosphate synthase TrpC n=1 Tax=Planctomicrobium sp. SH668 TaxID=3448126 RepID=UPI003F5C9933
MSTVLDKIIAQKQKDVATAIAARPLHEVQEALATAPAPRDFTGSLLKHHPMGMIAEVKKASPSAGLIREDFNPVEIARTYEENGAACISILTEEHFFQGHLSYLEAIRKNVGIPVLRKDFIIDPYQVWEARASGADAILLIAECLDDQQMESLYRLALELGMQALIEVYDPENVQRVLRLQPPLIGVNNRDLRSFVTDLQHTVRLREAIPAEVLVIGESGIHTRSDVEMLQSSRVHGILVGESLMRSADIGKSVRTLLGKE